MFEYIHHQGHLDNVISVDTCQKNIDLLRGEVYAYVGELLYQPAFDLFNMTCIIAILFLKFLDLFGIVGFGRLDAALGRLADLFFPVKSDGVFVAGNILLQGIDLFFVREEIIIDEGIDDLVENFVYIMLNIFFIRPYPG